jgi:hypothetical protein
MSSLEIGESDISDITFLVYNQVKSTGGFAFFAISGKKITEGMNQYA